MAEQKGSKLKQNHEFHELERVRDAIITEALTAFRIARQEGDVDVFFDKNSEPLAQALAILPDLDSAAVITAAIRYARSRKPVYNREIFRLLKAAAERGQFAGE